MTLSEAFCIILLAKRNSDSAVLITLLLISENLLGELSLCCGFSVVWNGLSLVAGLIVAFGLGSFVRNGLTPAGDLIVDVGVGTRVRKVLTSVTGMIVVVVDGWPVVFPGLGLGPGLWCRFENQDGLGKEDVQAVSSVMPIPKSPDVVVSTVLVVSLSFSL